jgi:hypothetical protein
MIGLALATVLATGNPPAPKPWELAYYRPRVTAGTQCVYTNGTRVYALFTSKGGWVAFIVAGYAGRDRDPSEEDIVPFKVHHDGYEFEANGGVTMYHMIHLALDHLTKHARRRPVSGETLDAFLHDPHPPRCGRPTFEADLYDKR